MREEMNKKRGMGKGKVRQYLEDINKKVEEVNGIRKQYQAIEGRKARRDGGKVEKLKKIMVKKC